MISERTCLVTIPRSLMASTSQPIALPSSSHNADYSMAEGSYTGSSGMFNPASYTRHFLGSPISWLAGSFGVSGSFGGGRFPMGSPTAQLLSSIEYVTLLTRLPRINRQSVRMNLEQVRHRRPQTGRSSMHSIYLTEIENSSVLSIPSHSASDSSCFSVKITPAVVFS